MKPTFLVARLFSAQLRTFSRALVLVLTVAISACASRAPSIPSPETGGAVARPQQPSLGRVSVWQPAAWAELPGWGEDDLDQAWGAILTNCEKPHRAYQPLCPQLRRLALSDANEKKVWIQDNLRPYRIEALDGQQNGLLTGYYEPLLIAKRRPEGAHQFPLYQMPVVAKGARFTYPRREIDLMGVAAVGLSGREIAYLDNPVDVLMVQIQGAARLQISEPDGQIRWVRVAFAGTNDQPYQSVARWLLDRGEIQDASWASIKNWVKLHAAQPEKVQSMFWSNPRVVFFKEERLPDADAAHAPGPKGAQGVSLTAGRSIAVDRRSIPYGVPVWLVSEGPTMLARKLAVAQDTGSAITGAVRADYFAGTGEHAGDLAGRLKQGLRLWVLWPDRASLPE